MFSKEVQQSIREELERGISAREEGNEGMARVCARRAAGTALREYLHLTGQFGREVAPGSAVDLLVAVQNLDFVPLRVKDAARHLLLKVDQNHNLTVPVDMLGEARGLADELEKLV